MNDNDIMNIKLAMLILAVIYLLHFVHEKYMRSDVNSDVWSEAQQYIIITPETSTYPNMEGDEWDEPGCDDGDTMIGLGVSKSSDFIEGDQHLKFMYACKTPSGDSYLKSWDGNQLDTTWLNKTDTNISERLTKKKQDINNHFNH